MAETVVIVPTSSEGTEAEMSADPPSEAVAEAATEVAETQADAHIETTRILAEEETERERVRADVEHHAIDAVHDDRITHLEVELGACRTTISNLEAENSRLTALLIPPQLEEPPPNPPDEPESVEDVPPAAEPESLQAESPPEPKRKVKRHRLI
jgi:hypothetical protein